jgi:asparagine synthase (glutamine-hydrolysing)
VLARMGRLLSHRGPDDEEFYDDGALALVYRRLSIVDLAGGDQPIFNEDGSKFIVVNGEIYNHLDLRRHLAARHQFSTQSDSEAPLHLFEEDGPAALARLRGMFALAIWDKREQTLFLARDRLGIKPLYICRLPHGLLFGSELKALLAHPDCPRDIDWSGLILPASHPLSLPRVPSYVRGIEHMPGGSYLVAARGKVETHSWWTIDDHLGAAPFDNQAERYQQEFEHLVEEATIEHLLGDVPIGLHLSGGTDSSLLAAVIAQKTHDVHCFSVVERTTWQCGDVASARMVTQQLQLPWHPVLFDHRRLLDDMQFDLARFEQSVHMMDSPRFDLEWIFKEELHRFARRQHPSMKVVLLGQGIDEFAGGYSRRLDKPSGNWNSYLAEVEGDLRYWSGVETTVPDRLLEFSHDADADRRWAPYHRKMRGFVHQLQHFQLWHEDRSSSSQSLEARVPYLDHRIVELLASVPAELHAKLFWNKTIVRDTLRKRLPSFDPERPKVQFVLTGDTRSLDLIVHDMLRRCVPAFLEKYLDGPELPLARDSLRRFATRVLGRQDNFYAEGWRLMECMAVAAFARQVQTPDADADQLRAVRERREGAPVVGESYWPDVAALFAAPPAVDSMPWTTADRFALPQGTRVMVPVDREQTYELSGAAGTYSTITVPQGMEWVGEFLRNLSNPRAANFTLEDWAEEFEIEQEPFKRTLDTLYLAGFVVRVPTAAQAPAADTAEATLRASSTERP